MCCFSDEADEYVEGGMSMDAQRYLNLNPFLDVSTQFHNNQD